jgi:hypothetical protein
MENHTHDTPTQGPANPAGRPAPETVTAVRELLKLFVKALNTVLLYPSTNHLPQQFRRQFFEAAQQVLQEHGTLLLATTERAFFFDGEPVYQDEPGDTNPATVLFRDGVREIGLLPSLTEADADAFLGVFVKALGNTDESPDVANLLWEAGNHSIYYRTIDHVIDGVEFAPPAPEDYRQTAHLFFSTIKLQETVDDQPEEDEGKDPHQYQGLQKDRYLQVRDIFHNDINAGGAHEQRIKEMVERDAETDPLNAAFQIYDEILNGTYAAQMSAEIVRAARRQFDLMVNEDNWTHLPRVLRKIKTWQANFSDKAHLAGPLREIVYNAGDKRVLSRMSAYLNDHPQIELMTFAEYLDLLENVSLGAVTAMLGDLKHHAARKMVYTYLGERADQAIDLVGNYVYDERWYVVRNVALVLGRVNRPRAATFLKKAVRHADARVRREAIRSLGALPGGETDDVLLTLLDDPDEQLRIYACKALAAKPSIAVFQALEKRVREADPTRLGARMERELLGALARAGGDRALPRLSGLIKKRKLFGKSRLDQTKINAVYALGEVGSPAAAGLLQELSRATDEPVREAAQRILAQAGQRRSEDPALSEDDRP